MMQVSAHIESWALKRPFRIAGMEWHSAAAVVVELSDGDVAGRGECQGVSYLGETPDSIMEQIDSVAADLRGGISREALLDRLPAGGARNAIDCALWDLEAKRAGKTIWQLTGLQPGPVTTVFTIGIESEPEAMGEKAAAAADCPVLKIKLDADRPLERLQAIRAARPDAELVVDANQAWDFETLRELLPACTDLGLQMIEQPLPRGHDDALEGFRSPIPLTADESCQSTADLDVAASRYDIINIKLDKAGGLTESLRLAHAARGRGCRLMVGNMLGTSLAMAPAFVIAQLCDFADIDGPMLLKHDRPHGLAHDGARVCGFSPGLWG